LEWTNEFIVTPRADYGNFDEDDLIKLKNNLPTLAMSEVVGNQRRG
jgi:hypothetical protein